MERRHSRKKGNYASLRTGRQLDTASAEKLKSETYVGSGGGLIVSYQGNKKSKETA